MPAEPGLLFYGCCSQTKCGWAGCKAGLRYSRAPRETWALKPPALGGFRGKSRFGRLLRRDREPAA